MKNNEGINYILKLEILREFIMVTFIDREDTIKPNLKLILLVIGSERADAEDQQTAQNSEEE